MEFRARALPTAGLAGLLLGLAALAGGIAAVTGDRMVVQAVLIVAALGLGALGLILVRRALRRPVMVRVDAAGVYMRRLNATFPWETIARIERVAVQGQPVIALEPANPSHPVWTKTAVLMTRAMSEKAGLPELVVDLTGTDGTDEAFMAAARAIAPVEIIDRA